MFGDFFDGFKVWGFREAGPYEGLYESGTPTPESSGFRVQRALALI